MTMVDFYFGPGSRYSYLAATQLPRVARETGAAFRWRAVLSSDLVGATGGVHRSPQDPVWRTTDILRWARHYDLPFHDVEGEVDWRRWALACVAAQLLDAGERFAAALYRRAYGEGRAPRDDAALADIAESVALEASAFRALMDGAACAETYASNLRTALEAGAFGVPTFVTPDGAVFWGQDRLPLLIGHLTRPWTP
jgi:2-hydroxychromene-2-carboxylate isomerase